MTNTEWQNLEHTLRRMNDDDKRALIGHLVQSLSDSATASGRKSRESWERARSKQEDRTEQEQATIRDAKASIERLRVGNHLDGLSVRQLIEEGRRF